MARDLPGFLDHLRRHYPALLAEVERQVNPERFEVTALLEQLQRGRQFPTVLFKSTTNLRGQPCEFSIVSNVFATREHCAAALGLPPEQAGMALSLHYSELERRTIPPEVVGRSQAPVKECVRLGEAADAAELPIVRHYEMDLGPVLTMAHVIKAPDEDFYDVTFCKTFYKHDPRRMAISIHSPHFERLLAAYERRDEPIPVVNVLGHHPAFYLGALALAPWGNNDYATIGSFLGEPLRLVPSETWGDRFLVPADAEIVIEGEIPPGERVVVDPFGEITRLYQAQCLRQVFNVKAITFRRGAIMQDVFSGNQGHWNLGGIPKEGSIYNALQRRFGTIRAVHLPYSGCSRLACYVSIDKSREGQAKEIGLVALTETWTVQTVVVVDADIDVFNEQDVLWAIHTYVDPSRDIDLVKNVGTTVFTTAMQRSKVIVDATRPSHVAFPERFKVPDEALARVTLEEWLPQFARPAVPRPAEPPRPLPR
ncbi:MAG: UbiD family decarboxylase [Chloroflexi bacterium]|nr:UbiD family decarboxylase [Chloroflexota bacterium]